MAGPSLTERIDALYRRARDDEAAFEGPAEPPDRTQAAEYLREGVAPAVAVYVEARTGEWVRFEREDYARLEAAMNTWLECYAACYGVDLTADYTLRTAAEALLDTHDINAVARVLTKVPSREEADDTDRSAPRPL